MALKQNIMNITTDGAARERDPVYLCFLKMLQDAGLGKNFVKLAKGSSAPTQVYLNARPGYYGSKGAAIIESTLMCIVDLERTPTESFAPLTLSRFTRYFLVPFIGAHLISQDLKCAPEVAFGEMLESVDAGDTLHPAEDGDEDLEDIMKANMDARRRERTAEIAERRQAEAKAEEALQIENSQKMAVRSKAQRKRATEIAAQRQAEAQAQQAPQIEAQKSTETAGTASEPTRVSLHRAAKGVKKVAGPSVSGTSKEDAKEPELVQKSSPEARGPDERRAASDAESTNSVPPRLRYRKTSPGRHQ
ncbi:hypothetical protein PAXINDRAFT_18796 [Paxillus involutus ATCC 200175]|uniref:Restriction of telomere capping protein 4 C-terminal domain-containing protein n=1 Tax=Paxillus involutus ATCC 200175 TaxID=664439 RepID=A0A0C9TJE9_PAXIN|nr:hypothetical protein PAXINDRAFT_18796 [Paxillus involutus ATCC 200175]